MDTAAISLNVPCRLASLEDGASTASKIAGCITIETVHLAYRREAAALYRFAMVRTRGSRAVTEDLMQQLWVAAQRGGLAVPEHELEHWLRGVLRNLIATHWRREDARSRALAPTANPILARQVDRALAEENGPSILERAELREQLLLALTELGTEDQDLLVAHYVEGRGQAELASRHSCGVRAIEGRLYRARAALRAKLAEPI